MNHHDLSKPSILCFREDLRLGDNLALDAANRHQRVLPVYVHDESTGARQEGRAAKAWRHKSLQRLQSNLQALGSDLICFRSDDVSLTLSQLCSQIGSEVVYWNRRYTPETAKADRQVQDRLSTQGVTVVDFPGSLLCEPERGVKANGTPYLVYTPYWRSILDKIKLIAPEPIHRMQSTPTGFVGNVPSDELPLSPAIPWDQGFWGEWEPGEQSATQKLESFIQSAITAYNDRRDIPSIQGTSRLSPHLHFGEITPSRIWRSIESVHGSMKSCQNEQVGQYAKEIIWREFSHHLLHHFPNMTDTPLRKEFNAFPWQKDKERLLAWQRGQTGYPIVDAGMRELWQTGWMHNRVRMIVASFLVKHLRLPWQWGEEWFWDTLVDADVANNAQGWQWSAGCGADAAPYFRIFNPILQGKKFDPQGDYIKRWCPELANLPAKFIHEPWAAELTVLNAAHIQLGKSYPSPIVNHSEARMLALQAYDRMRKG